MEITKFKHSCLVLSKGTESLVVDPGAWSDDFISPGNVVGVILTHEHADHLDKTKLAEIHLKNPNVRIYAHPSITLQLLGLPAQSVASGETVQIGGFSATFTGGVHATIHHDYPVPPNLGVLIDDGALYYPGDSFTLPDTDVEVLALPVSAPWLKVSEAMDFLSAVHPKKVFPTHNGLLSPEGHSVTNAWIEKVCGSDDIVFEKLQPLL